MKSGLAAALLTCSLAACVHAPEQAPEQTPASDGGRRMTLASLGRFAVFADLDSLSRDGDRARLRTLQIAEQGFQAGGRAYWGGWS